MTDYQAMKGFSGGLKLLSLAIFAAAVVWGSILLLPPVYRWFEQYVGYLSLLITFILSPFIGAIAPFYQVLVHGWWTPLIVCYGGLVLAFGVSSLGKLLETKE